MNKLPVLLILVVSAQAQTTPGLRGTVTDPSGAAVPEAIVQARGPGGDHRAGTNSSGQYQLALPRAGRYQVRIAAKVFALVSKEINIKAPTAFDAQLTIQTDRQVLSIEDQLSAVSATPEFSSGALVFGTRQLAALSDDPDELALQLQILAGPAPGPDGGQVFVDGFSGGGLPPKSSIREVRVNSNPFSPEYDHPGFGHIDVFTKPGGDAVRGQISGQFNDAILNSRNPLLTQSSRPPYSTQLFGLNIAGPIRKNKASFTFDFERRQIDENAFVLATTPDATINQVLSTTQTGMNFTPRLDYAIDAHNALVARYQDSRSASDNIGVGDFNLASRAYDQRQTERKLQLTETATLSPRLVVETRFQYLRSTNLENALSNAPGLNVQGAFFSGGATVGNSGSITNNWELTNLTIRTISSHTLKWGGRARQSFLEDTSRNNFAGTWTFLSLEQYEKTIPYQFSIVSGTPTTHVSQTDAGMFLNDDWRLRTNLTVSAGLRYEVQGNYGDNSNFAPRVGIAWGIDASGNHPAKTVLRAAAGIFYDRLPLTLTLNALRYNGETQQSYVISNPAFFPTIPSADVLQAARQPQQLRPVFAGIRAPRLYQSSLGVERQVNRYAKVSANWISTRGAHLLNVRNVNTPIAASYPFGDPSIRLLTESSGFSRLNQLVVNTNVNYRKLVVFGYYALSYAKDDNEAQPADPYNLRAEWGPSSWGDIRHKATFGVTVPLLWKLIAYPFLVANSGPPYNITTGLDPNNTGFPSARPPATGHNSARGPGATNVMLRLARTWTFGTDGHCGVTLSASTLNALNHADFAPPNGDLSSPYFGQYRSLGGVVVINHGGAPSTYNRKIDLQIRFSF